MSKKEILVSILNLTILIIAYDGRTEINPIQKFRSSVVVDEHVSKIDKLNLVGAKKESGTKILPNLKLQKNNVFKGK